MSAEAWRRHGNFGQPLCSCGSCRPSFWEHDAQGIPLCRCCSKCRAEKLARYRPEILSGYTQADAARAVEGFARGMAGGTVVPHG